MKYKIIVDKQSRLNPSSEKREYEIDIEELRVKGDVYDSLIITSEEDYVMRRLSLSEFHVLSVLEEPIKEPLKDINIELFEGDNYIYLVDMTGNKFYAEYLIKNEFNDLYVIHSEMNSAINQSAKEIELSVNQKLTNYSTTEEMNAAMDIKAGEINLEVGKKVNNEDFTGANIMLKVNGDTSEAQIKADKININGVVSANGNFKVDTNGNMECNNGKFNGGEIKLNSDEEQYNFLIGDDTNYEKSFTRMNGSNVNIYNADTQTNITLDTLNGQITISDWNKSGHVSYIHPGSIYVYSEGASGYTEIKGDGIKTPTLTQTSLEENKKNFEKLDNDTALKIILDTDIYKYNLKNQADGDKKHIGFVIGDKYKYSKEITSENNDGVDSYSMTSASYGAIQKLYSIIQDLQAEIKELKGEK